MTPAPQYEVSVQRDVVYGYGLCNASRVPTHRALMMDVYRPAGTGTDKARPCVILAFGGAFHRGSRQDDRFESDGQSNTPVAEYCRILAAQGYVACSIDYRLVQEVPDPGQTRVLSGLAMSLDRVNVVRGILGLEPIGQDGFRSAVEGAVDDMAMAFRYVSGAARRLGIDPTRIVIGGFSAGGNISLTASMCEDIDPAGVVCLSGSAHPDIIQTYAATGRDRFPVLLFSSENDLPVISGVVPYIHERLEKNAFPCRWRKVPGYGHFYPSGADLETGGTVLEELLDFLAEATGQDVAGAERRSNAA